MPHKRVQIVLVLTFFAAADGFSPLLSSPLARAPTLIHLPSPSLRAEEELRITLEAYTSPIRSCRSFNRASLRKVSGGAPKIGTASFKEQLAEVPLTLIDSAGTGDRWTQRSATASPFGVLAAPLSTDGTPKQAPPSHTAPH